jgi:hypothetical protein
MIQLEETYRCSHARLWEVLTDAAELSAWLGGPCQIPPTIGATVRLQLDGVSGSGVVRSFEPPREGMSVAFIEHTFVDEARPDVTSVCRWAVIDRGEESALLFSHDGVDDALPRGIAPPPLDDVRTVLLISYIGPEVPTALLEAGIDVFAKTGPGEHDWAHAALVDGEPAWTPQPAPPAAVDLVHTDWDDFPRWLDLAARLGARTIWYHSARTRPPDPADDRGCWLPLSQSIAQRRAAGKRGLRYVDRFYLPDALRSR